MKEKKININLIKLISIIIVAILLIIVIVLFVKKASNEKISDTTNLIINNRDVTSGLKHNMKIED